MIQQDRNYSLVAAAAELGLSDATGRKRLNYLLDKGVIQYTQTVPYRDRQIFWTEMLVAKRVLELVETGYFAFPAAGRLARRMVDTSMNGVNAVEIGDGMWVSTGPNPAEANKRLRDLQSKLADLRVEIESLHEIERLRG